MAEQDLVARYRRSHAQIPINLIVVGSRQRPVNQEIVDELAQDFATRGLLQPIGVRKRPDAGYDLGWGHHRVLAMAKTGASHIDAMVYDPGLPDAELVSLEIVENLKRSDLSADERHLHRIELAARLKELAEIQETERPPALEDRNAILEKRGGGRGKKGVTQKVAEAEGVAHTAVRHSAEQVARRAGEPVDLEHDSATELRRKAKLAKSRPIPRKTRPKRVDGDRAPQPGKGKGDLIVALRTLDLALPERFDADAWLVDRPKSQRADMIRLAVELGGRLERLVRIVADASDIETMQVDLTHTKRTLPVWFNTAHRPQVAVPEHAGAFRAAQESADEAAITTDPIGELTVEKPGDLHVAHPATQPADDLVERVRAHVASLGRGGQTKFADQAKVDRSTISKLLSGRKRPTEKPILAKIEAALGQGEPT